MKDDMIIKLLESAGDDFYVEIDYDGAIVVAINDFERFDKETGEEIYHKLKNEKLVYSIVKQLKKSALAITQDNLYCHYIFDECEVIWILSNSNVFKKIKKWG